MPQEEKSSPGNAMRLNLYDWLQIFVFTLITVILTFTFLGRLTPVDGSSMDPTLQNREMLLVQTIGYTPKQGDVVVFREDFRPDIHGPLVKRIIAVGGQTVDIDYGAGTVSVDGVVLEEPYLLEDMEDVSSYLPVTHLNIPVGSVFVMGDNRNGSDDSRNPALGAVDVRSIIGGARLILLPLGQAGPIR